MARKSEIAKAKQNNELWMKVKASPVKSDKPSTGKKSRIMTRRENRCKLCGRKRAFMRKFDICRICFRQNASKGLIMGVKKSSW